MEQAGYQVALDVFEGPLDLLLHLVKKHELSILDIPIAFVTEKYLEYLDAMAAMDVDVAGEYLAIDHFNGETWSRTSLGYGYTTAVWGLGTAERYVLTTTTTADRGPAVYRYR